MRKYVTLGDVCKKGSSNIAQKDIENSNGTYAIYGASGYIKDVNFYHQDKPYIAVVKDGAGIGRTMLLPEKTSVIGTLQYLIPNDSISVKYLYYTVTYMNLSKYFTGATIPHIYFKDYQKELLPLPPMGKQQEIAGNLEKIDAMIGLCNSIMEKMDVLVKSRFVEMFGDPENNPMDWIKVPMGNHITTLVDFNANGSYAYLDSNVIMYDHPDFALMVRTTDLEKNDFEHDVKYIDENAYNILSKSKVYGNEIIMNKIGSAGKVYLMPCLHRPVSLGRNAFMFRFDNEINVVFLFHQLTSAYGEKEIMQHVRGAVTKTITKDAARSVRIIVPPKPLQDDFESFVHDIDKSKLVCSHIVLYIEILLRKERIL